MSSDYVRRPVRPISGTNRASSKTKPRFDKSNLAATAVLVPNENVVCFENMETLLRRAEKAGTPEERIRLRSVVLRGTFKEIEKEFGVKIKVFDQS